MTLAETEALFSKAATRRAAGPDGIIDDLAHIAPVEMARLYHPLYTKAAMATVEPLAHKGGWQTSFDKPNSTAEDLSRMRMILLNNTIAKHHHRFLRGRLKAITTDLLRGAQSGARPNH